MKTVHRFKNRVWLHFCIIVFFISLSMVLSSCYPYDSISASETDIITTFRRADADFSTKLTYSMPDTVEYISDEEEPPELDPEIEQQILTAIDRNMQQAGYSVEPDPSLADVVLAPMVTSTTWVGGSCYPWYWDWWYGYPGWCYPYYYTYETGSLFIVMVDPEHAVDGKFEDALWFSAINGLLSSTSNTLARIDRDVDQAFEQSPYLSDGK